MSVILLLNASYEPLGVIPIRRALSLLLRDRVDAASEEVVTLQSLTQGLAIPVVLRLRRYVNAPRRGVRWSRKNVMLRDHYTCVYCGVQAGERRNGDYMRKENFTIDHVIPRSKGGLNSWGNTACACPACNSRKGDRTPHGAGMPMRWEPKTPRVDYLVASGNIPKAWKIYLEV